MTTILILGAAVWSTGASPTLKRRTLHASALWKESPDAWIIPCGGLGKHPPTEAQAMRDILVAQGVDPQKIIQEAKSKTTLENIREAVPIIHLLGSRSTTIVTDGYHVKRALMVARHFGLNAKTSSPTLGTTGFIDSLRQNAREFLARQKYRALLQKTAR